MKIVFTNNLNSPPPQFYSLYRFDESLSQSPNFVDIRKLVTQCADEWLSNLRISHEVLSQFFSEKSWWWKVTPIARLDARPWGQEALIKPLLFSVAVANWIQANQKAEQLTLVDCPFLVKFFISEFIPEAFSAQKNIILRIRFEVFKAASSFVGFSRVIFKLLLETVRVAMFIGSMNPKASVRSKFLILYELLPNSDPEKSYRYYFGSVLDECIKESEMSRGVMVYFGAGKVSSNDHCSILLNHVSVLDLVIAFAQNIFFVISVFYGLNKQLVCKISSFETRSFWKCFILAQSTRMVLMRDIVTYFILKRILTSDCKAVIYPYEEKGIEKVIVRVAREKKVRLIGYLPHPQHRFALALRDSENNQCLRPDRYGVCGSAYIDYLSRLFQKDPNSIFLWGSGKVRMKRWDPKIFNRSRLNLLLYISHPDEVAMFGSWLRANQSLAQNIHYSVQLYPSVKYAEQVRQLNTISSYFPGVAEARVNSCDELEVSDLVLFSATSAGVLAMRAGKLAIHVDLGEFFQINPCFDRLESLLHCGNAQELSQRLDWLCTLSLESIQKLLRAQEKLSEEIFSNSNPENIKSSLCFDLILEKQNYTDS